MLRLVRFYTPPAQYKVSRQVMYNLLIEIVRIKSHFKLLLMSHQHQFYLEFKCLYNMDVSNLFTSVLLRDLKKNLTTNKM